MFLTRFVFTYISPLNKYEEENNNRFFVFFLQKVGTPSSPSTHNNNNNKSKKQLKQEEVDDDSTLYYKTGNCLFFFFFFFGPLLWYTLVNLDCQLKSIKSVPISECLICTEFFLVALSKEVQETTNETVPLEQVPYLLVNCFVYLIYGDQMFLHNGFFLNSFINFFIFSCFLVSWLSIGIHMGQISSNHKYQSIACSCLL